MCAPGGTDTSASTGHRVSTISHRAFFEPVYNTVYNISYVCTYMLHIIRWWITYIRQMRAWLRVRSPFGHTSSLSLMLTRHTGWRPFDPPLCILPLPQYCVWCFCWLYPPLHIARHPPCARVESLARCMHGSMFLHTYHRHWLCYSVFLGAMSSNYDTHTHIYI